MQPQICSRWKFKCSQILHLARITKCFHSWHQGSYSGMSEKGNSWIFWWEDRMNVVVQRYWMDKIKATQKKLFAQCQRSGSLCDTSQARVLVLLGTCVTKYVVERKFQRPSRTVASYRIADGRHTQVSCATTNISSDRAIFGGKLVRWVRHFSSSRCTPEQQDSHQDSTGRELTMYLQSHLPVVWYRKIGLFSEQRKNKKSKSISTPSSWH